MEERDRRRRRHSGTAWPTSLFLGDLDEIFIN